VSASGAGVERVTTIAPSFWSVRELEEREVLLPAEALFVLHRTVAMVRESAVSGSMRRREVQRGLDLYMSRVASALY
jgi:hypothetical protein